MDQNPGLERVTEGVVIPCLLKIVILKIEIPFWGSILTTFEVSHIFGVGGLLAKTGLSSRPTQQGEKVPHSAIFIIFYHLHLAFGRIEIRTHDPGV